MKRIFSFAIIAAVLWSGFMVALPALAQSTVTPLSNDSDFIPELPLPGLFEGAQKMDSSLMSRYIQAIYVYFVWIVGVIAVTMVVYGGIRWVAAAGNPGRIKEARETIDGAIIGVLIALASVVLLNVINPKLTNLSFPGVSSVKPQAEVSYRQLKDANGNCFPANQIPCQQVCTDATHLFDAPVIGACTVCKNNGDKKFSEESCGKELKDADVLASEGNCVYSACSDQKQACTHTSTPVTGATIQNIYSCQTSVALSGGTAGSTANFTADYACGTIWDEAAYGGILGSGIGAHPERWYIGSLCEDVGGKKTYCVIDYAQAPAKVTNGPDIGGVTQVGKFPAATCE